MEESIVAKHRLRPWKTSKHRFCSGAVEISQLHQTGTLRGNLAKTWELWRRYRRYTIETFFVFPHESATYPSCTDKDSAKPRTTCAKKLSWFLPLFCAHVFDFVYHCLQAYSGACVVYLLIAVPGWAPLTCCMKPPLVIVRLKDSERVYIHILCSDTRQIPTKETLFSWIQQNSTIPFLCYVLSAHQTLNPELIWSTARYLLFGDAAQPSAVRNIGTLAEKFQVWTALAEK